MRTDNFELTIEMNGGRRFIKALKRTNGCEGQDAYWHFQNRCCSYDMTWHYLCRLQIAGTTRWHPHLPFHSSLYPAITCYLHAILPTACPLMPTHLLSSFMLAASFLPYERTA